MWGYREGSLSLLLHPMALQLYSQDLDRSRILFRLTPDRSHLIGRSAPHDKSARSAHLDAACISLVRICLPAWICYQDEAAHAPAGSSEAQNLPFSSPTAASAPLVTAMVVMSTPPHHGCCRRSPWHLRVWRVAGDCTRPPHDVVCLQLAQGAGAWASERPQQIEVESAMEWLCEMWRRWPAH